MSVELSYGAVVVVVVVCVLDAFKSWSFRILLRLHLPVVAQPPGLCTQTITSLCFVLIGHQRLFHTINVYPRTLWIKFYDATSHNPERRAQVWLYYAKY